MTSATRIEELKKRYEENPRRFFAPLANEYRKSGDLEQAIVLCQQHLTDQPANMNGHVVYGQALFESGRLEDARTTFETALTLDPENLIALRHLGDIARALGDDAGARAWYVRVLDADPRNEEIAAFISEIDAGATASPEAEPLGAEPHGAEPLDGEHVSGEALSAVHVEAEPPRVESLSDAVTPKIETQRRVTPAEPSAAVTPVSETQTLRVDGLSAGSSVPGSAPTPAVPQPAVPPPAEELPAAPPQRPSLDLMDLSIDLGAMAEEAPVRSLEPEAQSSGLPEEADNAYEFDEAFSEISLSGGFAVEPPSPLAPDVSSLPTDAGSLEFDDVDLSMPSIDAAPAEPLPPAQPVDPAEEAVESPASGFEVASLGPEVPLPVPAALPVPLVETPRPFVTETMAELYLQQGFREEAFAVYRQLVSENPLDGDLLERVHALESEAHAGAPEGPAVEHAPDRAMGFASESSTAAGDALAIPAASTTVPTPVSTPVATPVSTPAAGVAEPLSPTVREFFSAIAARRVVRSEGTPEAPLLSSDGTPGPAVSRGGTLDALFGSTAVAAEEEHLALAFARVGESVDPAMGVSGRPTQRAQDEVSLDRVFRDAPQRARHGVARRSEKLRFDQFFTPATDTPAQEHAPPLAGDPGSPAELEQFQDWLEQLKKP